MVRGLGFRVLDFWLWVLGFGFGFGMHGSGLNLRVHGSGFGVQGSEFRVKRMTGLGARVCVNNKGFGMGQGLGYRV